MVVSASVDSLRAREDTKGSSEWDRLAWMESQLQHFLAVQPWASDLTSLITSLPFC